MGLLLPSRTVPVRWSERGWRLRRGISGRLAQRGETGADLVQVGLEDFEALQGHEEVFEGQEPRSAVR